ncbi:MAG: hypothetical protein H8F28_03810, partial [Fibrella sp.]|nr:hypothetical protein [Armatimonadota bacterium]
MTGVRNVFHALIILFVAANLLSPVSAQGQSKASDAAATRLRFGVVNADLLADDPRLAQARVSGVSPRIALAELLEQWQAQTGVALSARDTDADDSGRWQVTAGLRDALSLADAMNALRSVMSEQGATWQWERSGRSPDFAYRFVRPLSLEDRAAKRRQVVQDDFENTVARIKDALLLPDDELKRAAQRDKTGVLGRLVEDNGLVKKGMAAFFSNLSEQQQKDVLRGGKLEIPYRQLDEQGKEFATAFAKYMVDGALIGGKPVPPEVPTELLIECSTAPDGVIPFLSIIVRPAGGWSFTRGLAHEAQWRDRLAAEVSLRDDDRKP